MLTELLKNLAVLNVEDAGEVQVERLQSVALKLIINAMNLHPGKLLKMLRHIWKVKLCSFLCRECRPCRAVLGGPVSTRNLQQLLLAALR